MTAATPTWPHLVDLSGPDAVRAVPAGQLPAPAGQIRGFLIQKVCVSGGRLGPNLGVVELTLALHRVFDSPRDALVFDPGHQAYVRGLSTGIAEQHAVTCAATTASTNGRTR